MNTLMQGLASLGRCRFGWAVISVFFVVVSCSSITEKERYVKLQRSVKRYASDIRWGYYDAAAGFIASKKNQPVFIDPQRLEGIRVTGYDMAIGELAPDSENASITVTFHYYDTNSGRLQSTADVQSWWYDESSHRWFLDGSLPVFLHQSSQNVR